MSMIHIHCKRAFGYEIGILTTIDERITHPIEWLIDGQCERIGSIYENFNAFIRIRNERVLQKKKKKIAHITIVQKSHGNGVQLSGAGDHS